MLISTRALDPKDDWAFFDPADSLSDEDRRSIRVLTDESASMVWREMVSEVSAERHPMLLGPDHWLGNTTPIGPVWSDSWSAPANDRVVSQFLAENITWPMESLVYFVWMRERAVQCTWGLFLRHWRSFLYDNEGPFLISLNAPQFVAFPPLGSVRIGERPMAVE